MKKDEIKKWREATEEEIGLKIVELEKQLFNLLPQIKMGQLKNCSVLKNIRKNIAILNTIKREKSIQRVKK
mgnify:FL=1